MEIVKGGMERIKREKGKKVRGENTRKEERKEDRILRFPMSKANSSIRIGCSDPTVPDYFKIMSHTLGSCLILYFRILSL